MERSSGHTLDMSLKSRGYHLEFKVKSVINGGFECYIFSDGKRVVIITGKCVHLVRQSVKTKMLYRYHHCQLGDMAYLEKYIESESFMKNPDLMTSEYGEMFRRLIDKIRSYGKIHLGSEGYGKTKKDCPMTGKVYFLSKYKRFRSSSQCRDLRYCRMT